MKSLEGMPMAQQFKKKVDKLFYYLRKEGVATSRRACCRTCGWCDLSRLAEFFVFMRRDHWGYYENEEIYIYGNYPESIYFLIEKVGLDYSQIDSESAIILCSKPNQNKK